jgi:hypothetical protein
MGWIMFNIWIVSIFNIDDMYAIDKGWFLNMARGRWGIKFKKCLPSAVPLEMSYWYVDTTYEGNFTFKGNICYRNLLVLVSLNTFNLWV